ncbi:hypothetical protein BTM25_09950 [Actinomadura rubteroloni]|uniref:Uncharacterized protein n=1 Tax=Actinomadura rubteroloni TaxID=1926885 RepID=A0A2P4UNG8_9ACTN|nr:hypothetical protein BTM25_09950 [Actinomadura rubteroloni]
MWSGDHDSRSRDLKGLHPPGSAERALTLVRAADARPTAV